ncbi:hypothetical protein [Thermogemmatispora sp.]|uniref:hypothetical protein n=1 Tax=Thermogemmatispora sp. TaxID=1968838 RepID=UPI0035E44A71
MGLTLPSLWWYRYRAPHEANGADAGSNGFPSPRTGGSERVHPARAARLSGGTGQWAAVNPPATSLGRPGCRLRASPWLEPRVVDVS